jgi:hypothetical protein
MPRFVALLHETPAGYSRKTHFDLMFEVGDSLRTWALDALPAAGQTVPSERLPDHRPVYLDFEGQLGGDRGGIRRVDQGDYELVEESETRWVVRLSGGKLPAALTLQLDPGNPQRWMVSASAG